MTQPNTTNADMTLTAFYASLKQQLKVCCLSPEQAEAEARQLLRACFDVSLTQLMSEGSSTLRSLTGYSDGVLKQCVHLVFQRVNQRTPLQYLLKEASFFGLQFRVSPAVLIPRPETELLVERALSEIQKKHAQKPNQPVHILDIGTGSGCIAVALGVTLSQQCPALQYHITALDISADALTVAKTNAERHGVRIRFLESDVFSALAKERCFDLILSNPPYVGLDEKETMQDEVVYHEPHTALFADVVKPEWGRYGFYTQFADEAKTYLASDGVAILEFGTQMKPRLETLFVQAGLSSVEFIKDYAGLDRFVVVSV